MTGFLKKRFWKVLRKYGVCSHLLLPVKSLHSFSDLHKTVWYTMRKITVSK